jgi:hypothetical protein
VTFFWPKVLRTAKYKKHYFQQDGARPHAATSVQTWLGERFGNKLVHKGLWPRSFPCLNICDFFLWGYLKSKVYYPLPKTLRRIERKYRKGN